MLLLLPVRGRCQRVRGRCPDVRSHRRAGYRDIDRDRPVRTKEQTIRAPALPAPTPAHPASNSKVLFMQYRVPSLASEPLQGPHDSVVPHRPSSFVDLASMRVIHR